MIYIQDIGSGFVCVSAASLRKQNPDVACRDPIPDATLAEWGAFTCTSAPRPEAGELEVVERDSQPHQTEHGWVWGWSIRLKTDGELASEAAASVQDDELRVSRIKDVLDDDRSAIKLLLKISFLQENRIRALEGKQPVTAAQFRAWVENQIE